MLFKCVTAQNGARVTRTLYLPAPTTKTTMISIPEIQGAITAKSTLEPAPAAAQAGPAIGGEIPVKSGDQLSFRELPDAERAERRVLAAWGAW